MSLDAFQFDIGELPESRGRICTSCLVLPLLYNLPAVIKYTVYVTTADIRDFKTKCSDHQPLALFADDVPFAGDGFFCLRKSRQQQQ
jgi:hypothetical protein